MKKVSMTVPIKKLPKRSSQLEELFAVQIKLDKLPKPVRELQFADGRKWRFDFAWPEHKLAAECEGGHWSGGRHTRGSGFEADCEKYNAAILLGWQVLRYTRKMIETGQAVDQVRSLIIK